MTTIGIIGGSGLYSLPIKGAREVSIDTPFGAPSDRFTLGRVGDNEVCFLPRHGRGHRLLPCEVPSLANVWAVKQLGADWLLSVSAVGSLREEIPPGHFVLPDQYIDKTHGRPGTFFGNGLVAHVAFGDPTCPALRAQVAAAAQALDIPCHGRGTYVCMEGPAFSTRAESHMHRAWGAHVIGMTALPEARLAREAQLHYATLALATDYDCWREEDTVTTHSVVEVLRQNSANVARLLERLIPNLPETPTACGCGSALSRAVLTEGAQIPENLAPLFRRA
jgi:5'-methylthioadenosine phosphorylase